MELPASGAMSLRGGAMARERARRFGRGGKRLKREGVPYAAGIACPRSWLRVLS